MKIKDKIILDACCGSRMFWFDKENPRVLFADIRTEVTPQMVFDLHSQGLSFNQISLKLNIDWGCVKKRYEDFIHDNPELLNSKQ